jgi:hypothetical protein
MDALSSNLTTIVAAVAVYLLTGLKGRLLKLTGEKRDFWLPVGSAILSALVFVVPDEWGVAVGEGQMSEAITGMLIWASANAAGSVPKKVVRSTPQVVGVMRKRADQ